MMRRISNGEPVFHTHVCSEARRGKVMTAEELHDFAVQCLMEEYGDTRADVVKYDKTHDSQPDFYFVNNGTRSNFSTNRKKKVNVLVIYKDNIDGDISGIDTSWLVEDYRRNGTIPRITFASAWCIADENGENGKPAICGGDFCFKYYSVSVLPDEENQRLEKKLSPVELAVKYAEAWRHFDASIVEPYLDKDFHYASDWVFDEMPCRAEYMDYFKPKLDTFSRSTNKYEVFIGRNHQTEQVCLIIKQHELSALVLESANGRITSARMMEYDRKFKPFNPDDELYMDHGDHLDAIMPANLLIHNRLEDIIEESIVWKKACTRVTTEDLYEERTDVISLVYGEDTIKLLTTLAYNKKSNTTMFMSIYPVCEGVPIEVLIDKVLEWDNQVEATVYCSFGEIKFAFFAIDYYCNKRKYVVGNTLTIDLAALAMKAREARRSFSFEGQQAIDWLAKIGRTPTYDEKGNVEPVRFSMENLVSYLNTDSKCPDEAEFQSPVGKIEKASILGIDFFKTMIIIGRRDTDEGELEVSVPLYFRQDFFPTVKEGDPVSGWLWLMGSIAGQHEQGNDEDIDEVDYHLGKMAADFDDFMYECDFKTFDNLMFVLDKLPLLKIRDGYELDAFQKGDSYGSRFQAYCCKAGSVVQYNPSTHGKYDDSMYIQGTIGYDEAESVPDYMPYFNVPFTKEGILQAWLLRNLTDFMPLGWHACYGSKTFVFETSRIENMFSPEKTSDRMKVREQVLALDLETLLPKVSIFGNRATLEYAYWNDWSGLVKMTVDVEKDGDSVKFGEPSSEVLVAYRSGLRF